MKLYDIILRLSIYGDVVGNVVLLRASILTLYCLRKDRKDAKVIGLKFRTSQSVLILGTVMKKVEKYWVNF